MQKRYLIKMVIDTFKIYFRPFFFWFAAFPCFLFFDKAWVFILAIWTSTILKTSVFIHLSYFFPSLLSTVMATLFSVNSTFTLSWQEDIGGSGSSLRIYRKYLYTLVSSKLAIYKKWNKKDFFSKVKHWISKGEWII